MTHLDIQAKTTKTAQFDGTGVDISALTGDWTLVLEVLAQDASDTTRFYFADSVDAFTANLPGPSASFSGAIVAANAPKRYTWRKYDFPSLRFGTTSAVLRLSIDPVGTTKSVTYQAYVEY